MRENVDGSEILRQRRQSFKFGTQSSQVTFFFFFFTKCYVRYKCWLLELGHETHACVMNLVLKTRRETYAWS